MNKLKSKNGYLKLTAGEIWGIVGIINIVFLIFLLFIYLNWILINWFSINSFLIIITLVDYALFWVAIYITFKELAKENKDKNSKLIFQQFILAVIIISLLSYIAKGTVYFIKKNSELNNVVLELYIYLLFATLIAYIIFRNKRKV